MTRRLIVYGFMALFVVGLVYGIQGARHRIYRLRHAPLTHKEAAARAHFLRRHPGEQPLNHRIARAAVRLYKARPMGKFVLGITTPDVGNDCSDFVACAIDEGVGAGARFQRHSQEHLIAQNPRYFDSFMWDRRAPLLPGDSLAVAHSPWYPPHEGACWHVGIIGSEGMVYDFVKLKRWDQARYGRHRVDWFVRNVKQPRETCITRLRPEYRYLMKPLPTPKPGR